MAHVEKCTQEHIDSLAPRLREGDKVEVWLATGKRPSVVLQDSFDLSDESWAVVHDGVVLSVFGLGALEGYEGVGVPWMLASNEFYSISRRFARECRNYVEDMNSKFPVLTNLVHAENTEAIRWLQWCGFTMRDLVPTGPLSVPFFQFTKGI